MSKNHIFASRAYWSNYIDAIMESIKEDKEVILDLLMQGRIVDAKVTMNLYAESAPSYQVSIERYTKKSPFGEENDE